ncbi:MAG: SDR family NAD(P)-dependent oxidoreductase [Candidatus Thorarchaeota archaeon]
MELGLEDKHVVITGASGGIGLELTRAFLAENANVTATFNRSDEDLKDMQKEWGQNLAIVQCDLRIESQVDSLFEYANSKFGRVDILIANAAIWVSDDVHVLDMSLEQWKKTMAVNLEGVFLSAKYFLQNLKQHSGEFGSIVLIGSAAATFGSAGHADYASAKAALHGIKMSLKKEIGQLARLGRVNLINPGWTRTPGVIRTLADPEKYKKSLQTVPLQKIATPTDVANAVLFLSSEKVSGHITGQTVMVTGGMDGHVLFSKDEINSTID